MPPSAASPSRADEPQLRPGPVPGTFRDENGDTHVFPSSFACNSFDPMEQAVFMLDMRVSRAETELEKLVASKRPADVGRMIELMAVEVPGDDDGSNKG